MRRRSPVAIPGEQDSTDVHVGELLLAFRAVCIDPLGGSFVDLNGRQNRWADPQGSHVMLLQPVNMDVGAANTVAFFSYKTRFGGF
jgi:hypothetical protein